MCSDGTGQWNPVELGCTGSCRPSEPDRTREEAERTQGGQHVADGSQRFLNGVFALPGVGERRGRSGNRLQKKHLLLHPLHLLLHLLIAPGRRGYLLRSSSQPLRLLQPVLQPGGRLLRSGLQVLGLLVQFVGFAHQTVSIRQRPGRVLTDRTRTSRYRNPEEKMSPRKTKLLRFSAGVVENFRLTETRVSEQ